MADLIVRGGTIVTADGLLLADVAVESGVIKAIGPELPGAQEEIDAHGLHVFPHPSAPPPGRGGVQT